jgi:hypothetical protein
MNKSKNIFVAIIGGISLFINLLLLGFNSYISMYPDDARKMFGDKFMTWFLGLRLPIIAGILALIFICCIIFSLWINGVFETKNKVLEIPSTTNFRNRQNVSESGVGLQNPVFNAPVTFNNKDDNKKVEIERSSKPEITFPNRWKHFEFAIKGSSPEQIMTCIKSGTFDSWFIHLVIDNKVAYDIDSYRTKFYDPSRDNSLLYGGTFSTIKYELGTKENGTMRRTETEKINDMFSVSIIHSGFGNDSKSTIRFDSNDKNAIVFYNRLKEELSKQFEIVSDWLIS